MIGNAALGSHVSRSRGRAGHRCGRRSAFRRPIRCSLEAGHPWRPPFGLDRVGSPVVAVVEPTRGTAAGDLRADRASAEARKSAVSACNSWTSPPTPHACRSTPISTIDELVLYAV